MNKRSVILFVLWVIFFLFLNNTSKSQPIFEITPSNIASGITVNDNSVTLPNCLLGFSLGLTMQVIVPTDFLPTLSPSILNKFSIQVTSIGGTSALSFSSANQLSLNQTIMLYSGSISFNSSTSTIQYQLPASQMTNYGWKAGTYTTNLNFTNKANLLITSCNSTPIVPLTLKVDPFINFQSTPQPITLTVDNLNYFRSLTLTGLNNFTNLYTVPLGINLKAAASTLNYAPIYSGAVMVNTPINYISSSITSPSGGPAISLSTGYQNISPSQGYGVPANSNLQQNMVTYTISPTNLKAGFLQAGDYTTTLTYQTYDASTTPQAAPSTAMAPFKVHVDSLSSLILNNPNVTLSFRNASDYTNGRDTTILSHLVLSSTVTCSVSVRAAASTLSNGNNTIPIDCVNIGVNGTSQSIGLTTSSQNIVSGNLPVIDEPINITYSVPQNKVSEILGKPPGVYTTQLIYTLTQP